MPIQTLLPRSMRAICTFAAVSFGLMMLCISTAVAGQQTTYLLDLNGRKVRIDGITFGGTGASQPEIGSATLRMRAESGESPLSQLAQTGSQPRLLLQYRDPQSNGMVHYEFDDVRFGRVRQIGQGSDTVEMLDITYTSYSVNTPGSLRRTNGGSHGVSRASVRRPVSRSTHHKVGKPHTNVYKVKVSKRIKR